MLSEEKQITDGKLITRLEVVKISKTPVDEASITIPADYKSLSSSEKANADSCFCFFYSFNFFGFCFSSMRHV